MIAQLNFVESTFHFLLQVFGTTFVHSFKEHLTLEIFLKTRERQRDNFR